MSSTELGDHGGEGPRPVGDPAPLLVEGARPEVERRRVLLDLGVVDGFQRLAVEPIQQIHQQQFLVLLLVLQSQLHHGRDSLGRILHKRLQPGQRQ